MIKLLIIGLAILLALFSGMVITFCIVNWDSYPVKEKVTIKQKYKYTVVTYNDKFEENIILKKKDG